MKEIQFVAKREAEWTAWEHWLRSTSGSGKRKPKQAAESGTSSGDTERLVTENLPHAFRRLCHDLALARDRQYSSLVQDRLRVLVLAVHQRIYGARKREGTAILEFVLHGFPALVRSEWRNVALAALLLWVPMAVMLVVLQFHPEGVYLLVSPHSIQQFEKMYSPTAKHLGEAREASSQWGMWGFYIAHNIKLDFQSFAGGIAFGLGAVFFLLYNGLFLGAVAGHLTQIGYIETFWSFVAGHSAFELTGAVLAGAAGLKLGQALIAPGLRSRRTALKENALIATRLLTGAALLTFFAAFIEAFWSSQTALPAALKYGIGAGFWTMTLAYLLFAGRGRNAA